MNLALTVYELKSWKFGKVDQSNEALGVIPHAISLIIAVVTMPLIYSQSFVIVSQASHELWDQEENASAGNQRISELSILKLISKMQSTQYQLSTLKFSWT